LFESLKHLSDSVINKISHGNALKRFNFDAFGMMGGRDKCTVAALRKLGENVDTAPKSYGGPAPLAPGEVARRVTSGDIMKMFMDVAKEDGRVTEKA